MIFFGETHTEYLDAIHCQSVYEMTFLNTDAIHCLNDVEIHTDYFCETHCLSVYETHTEFFVEIQYFVETHRLNSGETLCMIYDVIYLVSFHLMGIKVTG